MGARSECIKLAITVEPKTFHFDLPKYADNLALEIDSIIKHNKLLAGHTIKTEVRQSLSKDKYGNYIHEPGKQ